MKVTGETRIFRKDGNFTMYSTNISNKNVEGKWEKMYISVNFPKGTEIENGTDINIKDGFLSFYKSKEGMPKVRLVVTDFELKENFVPNDEGVFKPSQFDDDEDLLLF